MVYAKRKQGGLFSLRVKGGIFVASSNKTTHYALCQWQPDDPVLREDFNADNTKIDGLLKALDQKAYQLTPVFGTYAGTHSDNTQTINVGFKPSFVLVMPNGGYNVNAKKLDYSMAFTGRDSENLTLTSSGFTVKGSLNYADSQGLTETIYKNPYRYMALR